MIRKYVLSGLVMGLAMVIVNGLANYNLADFRHWYPGYFIGKNFILVQFAPVYLGFIGGFIGFRKGQLLSALNEAQSSLSAAQILKVDADARNKLLGNAVAQVNEGIIILDAEGRVIWVNEGFIRTSGFLLADVEGKRIDSFLHGPLTDHELALQMIESVKSGDSVSEEILTYRKDGTCVWLEMSIKPIFNEDRSLTNFVSIQSNITNRKERELSIAALYHEVSSYQFALNQSAIVFIFDRFGKILHVNNKFCELNQYSAEDLLWKNCRDISRSLRNTGTIRPIWNKLKEGILWKGEFQNQNWNGTNYWADITIVPIVNGDGTFTKFLAIMHDISERKFLQEKVATSHNRLEQAMQVATIGLS